MKLYNTLTRQKEEFVPQNPSEVTMYSCGPTVYNYFHIGNARPFIIFDALRKYLEYKGYKVKFAQNFTDVDDKIINRANSEGVSMRDISEKYIEEYYKDAHALGISDPTFSPRATENIENIIEMVQDLVNKGYAYNVNGDVYFSVEKFEKYGELSHQSLDELDAGARVEINSDKRNEMDFAVWKKAKPGEPSWESPWGDGRPGWHIECSAMSTRYLGKTIDIHSGGQDLIFPHHENEIAQSEASNGCTFARYWLHNGYINIDNQKMSKSAGNFFMVRDILKDFDAETVRFFMLSGHYRNPINFSSELMEQAKAGLDRLYNCIENIDFLLQNGEVTETELIPDVEFKAVLDAHKNSFIEALDDDFNTALAIAVLFDLSKSVNKSTSALSKAMLQMSKDLFFELGSILGLLMTKEDQNIDEEIELLIEKRQKARSEKQFELADEIRDELLEMGIVLQDTPSGVQWKRG